MTSHATRHGEAARVMLMAMVAVCALAPDHLAGQQSNDPDASTPQPQETDRIDFPGITIDLKKQRVDIEATVCLVNGRLELIACTRGTKEHESILSVRARPKHVHLGLLLLGAKNGKPAMRRLVGDDDRTQRWIDVPPRGDPIGVSLVLTDDVGKTAEHPISTFISRYGRAHDAADGADSEAAEDDRAAVEKFPDTFLFAGSHVIHDDKGRARYMADAQGHVISIATFGDELLCLPRWYSGDNEHLMWQANPDKLPKVGTKVTLRLRPKKTDDAPDKRQ